MALKLLSGIPFLDKHYGGMLLHQPLLVTGAAGSGKSAVSLQFIHKGLQVNQRCLYFTSRSASEVYAQATAFGMPVRSAIHARKLTLLEFSGEVPQSRDARELATHRFQQLLNLVLDQHIDRLAIDTLVPWIYPDKPSEVARFFESMTQTLTEASVTVLYTMPTPASKPAEELYSLLEENFPTTMSMEKLGEQRHAAHLLTYPSAPDLPRSFEMAMAPGQLLKTSTKEAQDIAATILPQQQKTVTESPDLHSEPPSAFILNDAEESADDEAYRPSKLPSTTPRPQKPKAPPAPAPRKSTGKGISFASSMLNIDTTPAKLPVPSEKEDDPAADPTSEDTDA